MGINLDATSYFGFQFDPKDDSLMQLSERLERFMESDDFSSTKCKKLKTSTSDESAYDRSAVLLFNKWLKAHYSEAEDVTLEGEESISTTFDDEEYSDEDNDYGDECEYDREVHQSMESLARFFGIEFDTTSNHLEDIDYDWVFGVSTYKLKCAQTSPFVLTLTYDVSRSLVDFASIVGKSVDDIEVVSTATYQD